jgi:hypothetical protein
MDRRLILLVLFFPFLSSCYKEKKIEKYEPSEWRMTYDDYDYLLKYVYIDKNKCLHVTRECDILDSVYKVEFVDTAFLNHEKYNGYCSECVNIPRYEHIEDIIIRNMLKANDLIIYNPEESILK